MEILLTGNTCFVTPAWVEMAFPEDHVLITCARGQPHPPRIRTITLDSKEPTMPLYDFMKGEVRYASLELSFPENAKVLFAEAEEAAKEKYESYKRRAEK